MKTQSQTETEFARILGRSLCCRTKGQIVDHVDTFYDAFGPPEILRTRRTKLLYWNFQREDGKLGFSLLVPFPVNKNSKGSIEVDVAAKQPRDFLPFMQWALDQVSISSNGEQAPRFLNASRFVVVPA